MKYGAYMSKILTGRVEGYHYSFREDDIRNAIELTPEYRNDLQNVCDILACNVEEPELREDGTVCINRGNFNDSYGDMMADLEGTDDDGEDGDDEDEDE